MADDAEVTVALCGDAGIARPTGVTLRSLVESCHDKASLRIVCLTVGWTDEDRRFVEENALSADIRFANVSSADLPRMHAKALVPATTYLRFLIPRFVNAGRAIYLDSDVLVRGDVSRLAKVELEGSSTGACRASSTPFVGSPGSVEGWRRLGVDPRSRALNAGVLVLDLDRWREERIGERALALAQERGETFRLADQAVLNVILDGEWAELHPRWNATTGVFDDDKGWFAVEDAERLHEAAADPAIVHFTGGRKPWKHGVERPFAEEWRATAREAGWTPWEERPSLRLRASLMKRRARRRLRSTGT